MARTPLWAIAMMVLCTLLLSAGQLTVKIGTAYVSDTTSKVFYLAIGFILYVAAGVLMTLALKHGDLSVLYPIVALGFVWVTLLSIMILGEDPSWVHITGTLLIITGITIIGHKGR